MVTYQTFKAQLGNIPVYPTLGNHDSLPEAFNTENALNPDGSGNALGWNYQMLSDMWANDSWITSAEQQYASTHYAAYAHTTESGLRVISLNTDFWYGELLPCFVRNCVKLLSLFWGTRIPQQVYRASRDFSGDSNFVSQSLISAT